jgi:hypothetical protein
MKPAPLLLNASLLLNAALLAALAFAPRGATSAFFSAFSSSPATPASAHADSSAAPGQASVKPSPEVLATALKTKNHAALRDQLRALGLPDDTVLVVMRAMLWQPYYERQREFNRANNPEDAPYWRGLTQTGTRAYTPAQRAELRQLASEIRDQTQTLLGLPGIDTSGVRSQRYAFLPPETAAKLLDLDRDYGEMRHEINQEAERFRVPSDTEKLRFLDEERRNDLAAILTPDQLAEYDLRYSPAALTLRNRLSSLDVTETEYRRLYELIKPYEDISLAARATPGTRLTTEQVAALRDDGKTFPEVMQDVRTLLGEDRYQAYRRARDPDYRQLKAAADRFQLPVEKINQVYALRDTTSAETQRIAKDTTLTPAQKRETLQNLTAQTRQTVLATLGQEIGTAYLDKNMKWLDRVQSGYAVTFSPESNRASYQSVTPARPRPAPTPAPKTNAPTPPPNPPAPSS